MALVIPSLRLGRFSDHWAAFDPGKVMARNASRAAQAARRQGVAVARAAVFARKLVIMDEPTAALGERETGQVLALIRTIRDRGLPVVLISHNMPNVFELADRIFIMRLGRRAAVVSPKTHTMADVVAIMTGAVKIEGG